METIVTEIIKTIKDSDTVIERDMKLLALFFELFRTALEMALEQLDLELATEYKKQGYVVERRDRRTVQCLCGTVSFVRRRMKKPGKKGIYPLDKQLRLKPYQRFSALLMKKVAETATSCVYRKTADIVNRFTLTNLSHQTVKHIVMQSGKLCQEWQDIQRQETPAEETETPIVYIEGDGLAFRGRHKKQLEIHRIQVYEGREKEGKRTQLIHAYHMASTEYEKTWERAGWYMHRHYGLSNTIVISNGDGGPGYGYEAFQELAAGCKWHEHQRDVYHVHRKVKERLHFAAPEVQDGVRQSIWNHDKTSLALWLDTAESEAEGNDELQDVERLRKYLMRNWTYVEPLNQRQMPENVHLIQPGACEAGHRIYSYRMKHQGRCWSQEGAEAMVQLITAMKNKEWDAVYSQWGRRAYKPISQRFKNIMRKVMKRVPMQPHKGVHQGSMGTYSSTSSPLGKLAKGLQMTHIL